MKLLASMFLLSYSCYGQATVTLASVAAGEPSLPVTFSATAVTNITAWIAATPPNGAWPNTVGNPNNSTLASAVTDTTATTISIASATNLVQCNGIKIDSEVMAVVSVSGNTVTVIRGSAGTTAATHLVNTPVTVLRVGNYTCQMKVLWADGTASIVRSTLQGAAITAQTAAKAAADASIATTVNQSVQ